MGRIHAGKQVTPGGRYDRMITFLRKRGEFGATGLEIEDTCHLRAAGTVASELRSMGYTVDSERQGRSEWGGTIWRYWLRGEPASVGPAAPPGELFPREAM